ncbi:MAG: ArsC family reductase, partial [Pseudomonadota bacterium]
MITIYGIKNCDTMKKARKWLDENEITYEFHDYKKQGIDADTLQSWSQQVGWETLLNKRGTTWRKLPDDKREAVDEPTAIELMQEFTSLIKRPVIA